MYAKQLQNNNINDLAKIIIFLNDPNKWQFTNEGTINSGIEENTQFIKIKAYDINLNLISYLV